MDDNSSRDKRSHFPPLTYLGLGQRISGKGEGASHLSREQLMARLGHAQWSVRVATLKRLEKLSEPLPLEILLSILHDEHPAVRAVAAHILGKQDGYAPIAALIELLEDADWYVRSTALAALSQYKLHVPVEIFQHAVADRDASVRMVAVTALGHLGERAPIASLIAALSDDAWMVREAAVLALGSLGERAPYDLLLRAMTDRDANVQQTAQLVVQQLTAYAYRYPNYVPSVKVAPALPPPAYIWMPEYFESSLPTVPLASRAWSIAAFSGRVALSVLLCCLCIGLLLFGQPSMTASVTPNPIVDHFVSYSQKSGASLIAWAGQNRFAQADASGTVRVVDAMTRRTIALYNTPAHILNLVWVGESLYTTEMHAGVLLVRKDNTITVLSIPTLSQHPIAVFSPDGKHIALALNEPGKATAIDIWNIQTGYLTMSYTAREGPITAIAWPPQGNVIASVSTSTNAIGQKLWKMEMWNVETGKSVLTRESFISKNQRLDIVALSWSSDGLRLAYTLGNGIVYVYDRETSIGGSYRLDTTDATNWNGSIAWSPDGKYLAATTIDGEVQVWDVSGGIHDGSVVCVFHGHKASVAALAWAPSAAIDRMLSSDTSGALFVWDIR